MKKHLLAAMLALSGTNIQAAPGDLDGSFGVGGTVVTPISPGVRTELAYDVAVQADGKIVVAGGSLAGSENTFLVARYNANGSLDTSFGAGGKVTTSNTGWTVWSVAIQPDGKIVAAGDSALVRYNPDGSLDPTFGDKGIVRVNTGSSVLFTKVAFQQDGKILAAGWARGNFFLARYNPEGGLDPTFDGDGIATIRIAERGAKAWAMVIQPDGRIVMAGGTIYGYNSDDFALVRYNSNGSLDSSFGNAGIVITPVGTGTKYGDAASAVMIQPDGKIIAAGISDSEETEQDFALVRYHPNGSLDLSFGSDGIVITPARAGYFADGALDAILLPSGKIVAIGLADMGPERGADFTLVGYNADGSLDTSFGNSGIVNTDVADARPDIAVAGALQPDGKIITTGWVVTPEGIAFGLARYNTTDSTNRPPICTAVAPSTAVLTPPDHKMQLIALGGATDPDGDALMLTVTGVTQDEPVNGTGDGDIAPDAQSGFVSNQVYIRSERSGLGDGRVYHLAFSVTDIKGGTCSGTVKVSVPRGNQALDSEPDYDSFSLVSTPHAQPSKPKLSDMLRQLRTPQGNGNGLLR